MRAPPHALYLNHPHSTDGSEESFLRAGFVMKTHDTLAPGTFVGYASNALAEGRPQVTRC
jgi:hypothetical protein